MARPRSPNKTEQLNIRIPTAVITRVRILLTQPLTGKIAYSGLAALVTGLLAEWLERQEALLQGKD